MKIFHIYLSQPVYTAVAAGAITHLVSVIDQNVRPLPVIYLHNVFPGYETCEPEVSIAVIESHTFMQCTATSARLLYLIIASTKILPPAKCELK